VDARHIFSSSSGIAIAPILFVIALLAILATAIAAASSTFSSGSGQETARVAASTMLDLCTQHRTAVSRVMALGCTENQISFENSIVSGYTNGSAPSDQHCHIFHPQGGGLVYRPLPAEYAWRSTGDMSLVYKPGEMFDRFAADNRIPSLGSDADYAGNELIYAVINIRGDICDQINSQLKNPDKSTMFAGPNTSHFVGVFQWPYVGTVPFPTSTSGKMAMCTEGYYYVYSFSCVLLVR
jgi:hypothetical protein